MAAQTPEPDSAKPCTVWSLSFLEGLLEMSKGLPYRLSVQVDR